MARRRGVCKHCCRDAWTIGRGLCWKCFDDRDVRAKYPTLVPHSPWLSRDLEIAIRLKKAGWSHAQIGRQFGRSKSSVQSQPDIQRVPAARGWRMLSAKQERRVRSAGLAVLRKV